ncbi:5'/3'-nucleotidase SurE [bacterium]|nr:5'/3'-nucleotidase SurE [bacterium]
MRILLSNDDGIDAPGLASLAQAVAGFGELFTYAPADVQSGCSHKLTTDDPFRVHHRDEKHVAVVGTPGDCVRYALHDQTAPFDWILSGINNGGNLGVDVFYSGTVAAVREASFHGLPGIAYSHYIKRDRPIDWDRVAGWAKKVTAILLDQPRASGWFWSVNFPHLLANDPDPEIIFCPLDVNPLPLQFDPHEEGLKYSGVYANRPRTPGHDVDVCFSGKIAVTRLSTCHGSHGYVDSR